MVRSLFLLGFMLLIMASCDSNNTNNIFLAYGDAAGGTIVDTVNVDSIKGAYLSLSITEYDFGEVRKKKTPSITIEFEVENTGNEPLVIIKSDVSCGCLSVDYPKEPIMKGQKAKLRINIETKSQEGTFNKTAYIKSNAKNDIVLVRVVGRIK